MTTARPLTATLGAAILGLAILAGPVGMSQEALAQEDDISRLPEGPNRDLVARKCGPCHPLSNLTSTAGRNRERWNEKINDMVLFGLRITPEERTLVLDYLATYLPP
jgi:hypothetical protein